MTGSRSILYLHRTESSQITQWSRKLIYFRPGLGPVGMNSNDRIDDACILVYVGVLNHTI